MPHNRKCSRPGCKAQASPAQTIVPLTVPTASLVGLLPAAPSGPSNPDSTPTRAYPGRWFDNCSLVITSERQANNDITSKSTMQNTLLMINCR
jgi:hypothetical protein